MLERNLTGLRVLDFTRVLAGPYLNQMLCDLGAEVIKIERIGAGTDERNMPPFGNTGQSGYFMSYNRGKKSIALNLKSPQALDLIFELAKDIDIVTENFRPGVMNSLGLSYAAFKAINPKIIMCSISLFGQKGYNSDLPGYDINAQSMSGFLWMTGDPDRLPMRCGTSIGDTNAATHALAAILAAIYRRDRMGQGQYIDISMRDCLVSVMEVAVPRVTMSNKQDQPQRTGTHHGAMAPYGVFEGTNGYIAIGCLNDQIWKRLAMVIERPDLATNPEFLGAENRYRNLQEVILAIETWTKAQPSVAKAVEVFSNARVPATPVLDIAGVVEDKTLAERNFFVEIEDPVHGKVKLSGIPMLFSDTTVYNNTPPPLLGQHTNEILESLGLDPNKIAELRQQGIVA